MPIKNFVWDMQNDCTLMEKDGTAATIAVYTNEQTQFGHLFYQHFGNETRTYHFDAQLSARQLTNANQNVTDEYVTTAFGEAVATTGVTMNPFRFVGRHGYYLDHETDTYYVRARMYEVSYGRWQSYDPILSQDDVNWFLYVHNNPLSTINPAGLQHEPRYMTSLSLHTYGTNNAAIYTDQFGLSTLILRKSHKEWYECRRACQREAVRNGIVAACLFVTCLAHRTHICRLICYIAPGSPVCLGCLAVATAICMAEAAIAGAAVMILYRNCLRRCGPEPQPPTPIDGPPGQVT
jgi:RHS repeat-associated protein